MGIRHWIRKLQDRIRISLGILPIGWFVTVGDNGFWVVYDTERETGYHEPQAANKNRNKAVSEALTYAKHAMG